MIGSIVPCKKGVTHSKSVENGKPIVFNKLVKCSKNHPKNRIAGIAAIVRLTKIERTMYTVYPMDLAFIIFTAGIGR